MNQVESLKKEIKELNEQIPQEWPHLKKWALSVKEDPSKELTQKQKKRLEKFERLLPIRTKVKELKAELAKLQSQSVKKANKPTGKPQNNELFILKTRIASLEARVRTLELGRSVKPRTIVNAPKPDHRQTAFAKEAYRDSYQAGMWAKKR